ncbi:Pyruvate dehydrogenase [NADP(+)], mitochondrial [Symbiodinium microadriaticum]|uniref:Pyruvate dehydrogenase [NADP(+)], mitochondrial n=1 Tax=Symbiodinium microadriaticum TaxID=2951 RepID=A0A1Q9F713_SYMMI|nr:Pyruvate dehydrogenase [NADP(+)], mitochondrial [Symbiodinium microadriaticum]
MGSGAGVVEEYLAKMGDKAKDCGILNVHLYRRYREEEVAVRILRRMVSLCTSLQRAKCSANVINGRYGLSSKDFTPGMVDAIYNNLRSRSPKHPFTVGLEDVGSPDVTHYSLPFDRMETVPSHTKQCIFWGFGSVPRLCLSHHGLKVHHMNEKVSTKGRLSMGPVENQWSTPTCVCRLGFSFAAIGHARRNTPLYAQGYFKYDALKFDMKISVMYW